MSKSKEIYWEMALEELREAANHVWNSAVFRAEMAEKIAIRQGETDEKELKKTRSGVFKAFIEEGYDHFYMVFAYMDLAGIPIKIGGKLEGYDPKKVIDRITESREEQKREGEIFPNKLTPNMMKILLNNSEISEALNPRECPECFTSIRPWG